MLNELRIVLSAATEQDDEFQYRVYASTRAAEMVLLDWSAERKEQFLRMQYRAQQSHYHTVYPQANYHLIFLDQQPVGRMIVDRSGRTLLLMDIALLPEQRGQGLGTHLLKDLLAEARASQRTVRLHVEQFNPALRLYERLGFVQGPVNGIYIQMEYSPDGTR